MSEVVIDVFTRSFPGQDEGLVEQVLLKPWQVRELLGVISAYRLKCMPTSYAYLDRLHDALSEAL